MVCVRGYSCRSPSTLPFQDFPRFGVGLQPVRVLPSLGLFGRFCKRLVRGRIFGASGQCSDLWSVCPVLRFLERLVRAATGQRSTPPWWRVPERGTRNPRLGMKRGLVCGDRATSCPLPEACAYVLRRRPAVHPSSACAAS